ncbi:hypothetical protein D3C78_902880 [compost metagenome]
MATPQGREQRTTHLGLDLRCLVVLERFGPDGAADVVDQHIEAPEALDGGLHHPAAFVVLLKVGGQGQHLSGRGQLLLHFEHQLGTIHQDQLRPFGCHALGHPLPDALGSAGDQRDFFVKSVHVYLIGQ